MHLGEDGVNTRIAAVLLTVEVFVKSQRCF